MNQLGLWLTVFFTGPALHLTYLVLRSLTIAGGAVSILRKSQWAKRRRVFQDVIPRAQWLAEAKSNVRLILLDCAVGTVLVLLSRNFSHHRPVGNANALTLVFLFSALWMEFWVYCVHRLLHTKALFFIHRQHHLAKVPTPLSALSFSSTEWLLIASGLLGLRFVFEGLAIPTFGIALYAFFNYVMNVVVHSGVEYFPAVWVRSRWLGWIVTPTYHALHHARGEGHYGLYSTFLDRWLGTAFADYKQVHERAITGQSQYAYDQITSVSPKEKYQFFSFSQNAA